MGNNSQNGSVTVEGLLILPLSISLSMLLILSGTHSVLRAWIYCEAYALARSHLYGNELNYCSSFLFNKKGLLQQKTFCSFDGFVRKTLLWKQSKVLQLEVNLERNI